MLNQFATPTDVSEGMEGEKDVREESALLEGSCMGCDQVDIMECFICVRSLLCFGFVQAEWKELVGRDRAAEVRAYFLNERQPLFVYHFSQLQNLCKGSTEYQWTLDEGIAGLRFVMHMFEFQRPGQRSCVHEHPWSWEWHFVKEAFSAKGRRRIPRRVANHLFNRRQVLVQTWRSPSQGELHARLAQPDHRRHWSPYPPLTCLWLICSLVMNSEVKKTLVLRFSCALRGKPSLRHQE